MVMLRVLPPIRDWKNPMLTFSKSMKLPGARGVEPFDSRREIRTPSFFTGKQVKEAQQTPSKNFVDDGV